MNFPQMQSDHLVRSNLVSKYVEDMLEWYLALLSTTDHRLTWMFCFKFEYDHQLNESICQSCDGQYEVLRPECSDPRQPVIHCGVIASGDRVIKDARERDLISRSVEGAICFEKEAAGLMNDFRCIVIRGISDYADLHKNDVWRSYAAAAAAAAATIVSQSIE
ncbi:hypothetical protein ASPACDRAFT_44962 [Aspergillus aculeatus ATCC 16872]|uniref:Nucleoside phosphorylase domain-containing protein n=1 Tax=Aspergillus aculeatus (strain ATCC 16872 / CBS 172.66 / WB 5094) TaxID=690307 RepID=A0A1L9WQL6_ASPA1|nr:uncharacterized protein ASPACDRAFT_44962 [Aspergillus aculeatus ATCC 16872]OJJ98452.1 hypothetical protein ASPACDRAFT_44962 [Aspergillus aculeatus ATCC 16872]